MRLIVICEGQTEARFIESLNSYFAPKGVFLAPRLLGKPGHKGGRVNYQRMFTDIRNILLSDTTCCCTSFFDFYGLDADFPGKAEATPLNDPVEKRKILLENLVQRLVEGIGEEPLRRFIPYVQMYEFEGLLFSDPQALVEAINQPRLLPAIQNIRDGFDTPEHINDSPNTAPSKRIGRLFASYQKVIHGALTVDRIGLDRIRQECPLFSGWFDSLEALAVAARCD